MTKPEKILGKTIPEQFKEALELNLAQAGLNLACLSCKEIGAKAATAVRNAIATNPILFTADLLEKITGLPKSVVYYWIWGYKNER